MSTQGFPFRPFSRKQLLLLNWWRPGSPYARCRMVVADGAIRSGKTVAMLASFLLYSRQMPPGDFIIAGRSVGSLKRNVVYPMLRMMDGWGWKYVYNRGEGVITAGKTRYFLFGASNEPAQDKLQGMTASGALADEVALFPQSFVDQMIGRCSVASSRIFMNCNPRGAWHYFKTKYIDRADEIGLYYLHFTMDDNLTLSPDIRESYARAFTGVFYRQYILGEWVSAEGAVYPMWDDRLNAIAPEELPEPAFCRRYIGIDYGTHNPMVYLDALACDGSLYITREYCWDSAKRMRQKTDSEYADDLDAFTGGDRDLTVIIDPSAASFIEELRRRGYRARPAVNDVRDGISVMATLIGERRLLADPAACPCFMAEIHSYVWDEKAGQQGVERPLKEHDHAMDAARYLCRTVIRKP